MLNDINLLDKYINSDEENFVIGGATIYKLLLPKADKLYLTKINENFEGDVYFPEIKQEEWKAISKEKGIMMLIRSMAPEVIACDEIGSSQDVQAIEKAVISGVKGIFTMHGKSIDDVKNNKEINKLLEKNILEKIIFI